MTLWLIGGTSESKQIARSLADWGYPWLATVTTSTALQLYASLPGRAEVTRLSSTTVHRFLSNRGIQAIIDASHPFATEISCIAIQAAKTHNIPYLRYERPVVPLEPSTILLPNFSSLLQPQYLESQRVLLTTGVKTLALFRDWQTRSLLWARILPTDRSKQQALAAGFPASRLIQQKLPVIQDREMQLWRSLNLTKVVTKESGDAGGFSIKQDIARQLGIDLIAVARPPMQYPQCVNTLAEVISFCQSLGNSIG